LIAVFQQHICSEVNTLNGVVEALTGILESVLFMQTNAASSGLYGSRGRVGRSKKIGEAQHVVDERLATPNISVIRISLVEGRLWCLCALCPEAHNPALSLVKSPACLQAVGDYYMGKAAGGRKGPARQCRRLLSMSKRTTRFKQWRWEHFTSGAQRAS
jgi:hypothetical protein